jgi:hypothetical protein
MNLMRSPGERFLIYVDRTPQNGCWVWIGDLDRAGYGKFWHRGYNRRAHRFAYEWFVGPIPEGLQIDHLCRNPPCVRPSHLEPVPPVINTARGLNGAMMRTHCPHGHPYAGDNLMYVPSKNGRKQRRCRECHRVSTLRAYYRRGTGT